MDYPIPLLTAKAFEGHRAKLPQNPGLIFDRFAPDWSEQPTIKKAGLETVRQAAEKVDKTLLEKWIARWEAAARAAHADLFPLKTDWRFVAGFGRKGPLEVGFTFHRYGFPILPGSSVKGIARAYAWLMEERNEADPDFLAIFGRAPETGQSEAIAQTGAAVFFDAIPGRLPKLELDIMNPHYPKYYQGNDPPTDGQNPNPVYFLTVAPNTEFRFAVGWRGQMDETARGQQKLAVHWLVAGLTQLGAGAKTSAGYGYFQNSAAGAASVSPPVRPRAEPEPTTVSESPAWPRRQGRGQVRYDSGKPIIVDASDPTRRLHVDWKALGMDALPGKTSVDYECEEPPGGRPKVVKVAKAKS